MRCPSQLCRSQSTAARDRRSARTPPGRSTPRCPCQSVTSSPMRATCAAVSAPGRAPRVQCGRAQHPRPHRAGQRGKGGGGQLGVAAHPLRLRDFFEHLGIIPQLASGPRQRLGHSGSERRLERGQRVEPDPDPGEPAVGVVRVRPRAQAERRARRGRDGPAHAEQRPGEDAAARRHARQRPGAGPAGEPEQHGLRLVVEGVAEQHRGARRRRRRPSPARRTWPRGPPPRGRPDRPRSR